MMLDVLLSTAKACTIAICFFRVLTQAKLKETAAFCFGHKIAFITLG